jgi:hypothetical protein
LGQPDYGLGNDGKQFRELNQIDAHLSHQESSNILEGRTRSIQRRSRFYEDVFLLFIYFVGIQVTKLPKIVKFTCSSHSGLPHLHGLFPGKNHHNRLSEKRIKPKGLFP